MNLFQIKNKPHGIERLEEFLENEFVAIGWPEIGDLTNVEKADIKKRLQSQYDYEGQQLGTYTGSVNAFVNTMSPGDLVITTDPHYAYLGKIDAYEYHEEFDNQQDGHAHQRQVRWLSTIAKEDLNEKVQELIKNRGTITQFKHPIEYADLKKHYHHKNLLSEEAIKKALEILEESLDSEDDERRFTAAVEITRFVQSS